MIAAEFLASLAGLQAAVDEFLKCADAGGFAVLDGGEFVEVMRQTEALRRQLATADYPIVAEAQVRQLSEQWLSRNAAGLLADVWRLTRAEAHARVGEAAACGERVAVSGERLTPLRPRVAAARRAGILGVAQVRAITRTLDALPVGAGRGGR